jgi:hypothetical protein
MLGKPRDRAGQGRQAQRSGPVSWVRSAACPALLPLLTCAKGAKVSLEHLDDVAIHEADGTVCLEQTKSALKQNPLSDWAPDFWKALANWAAVLNDGLVEAEKVSFRLYVTPPRTGTLAQALSDATTVMEASAIMGEVAKNAGALKRQPACMEYLKAVLDLSAEQRAAIIVNMQVVSCDDDPVDPIRALLAPTVPPELIDLFCVSAIGMAKQQADRLIQRGAPAALDGDAFKTTFRAFVQKNLMPGLLTSLTPAPEPSEVTSLLSTRPIFIRQLELIDASEEERLRAVSDFLRTSADKADWADRGLIFEESLRDWDEDLVRRHGFISADVADRHTDRSPGMRGRIAYRQCALLQAPLEGRAVPGHFVHGCYNTLADARRIGWHLDFANLLDDEQK